MIGTRYAHLGGVECELETKSSPGEDLAQPIQHGTLYSPDHGGVHKEILHCSIIFCYTLTEAGSMRTSSCIPEL